MFQILGRKEKSSVSVHNISNHNIYNPMVLVRQHIPNKNKNIQITTLKLFKFNYISYQKFRSFLISYKVLSEIYNVRNFSGS